MGESHAGKDEIAELTSARLDDRRVIVPDEDVAGDEGREQSYGRRRHRYYRLDVAPQRVLVR